MSVMDARALRQPRSLHRRDHQHIRGASIVTDFFWLIVTTKHQGTFRMTKSENSPMTEDQIKHMVDRFLGWRLPENFSPDNGISFKPTFNDHLSTPMRHDPSGTNLFDARQAEAMVRYMVEGLDPA